MASISMRIGIEKHDILKSNINNNRHHLITNSNVTKKTKIITFGVLKNEHCILRFTFTYRYSSCPNWHSRCPGEGATNVVNSHLFRVVFFNLDSSWLLKIV